MPVAITDDQMQNEPVIRKANDPPLFRPWLWFALGSILLLFSYGIHNIPIAAWLAPVFLLYFVRSQRWRVWVPVVYLAQACRNCLSISRHEPRVGCRLLGFPCRVPMYPYRRRPTPKLRKQDSRVQIPKRRFLNTIKAATGSQLDHKARHLPCQVWTDRQSHPFSGLPQ